MKNNVLMFVFFILVCVFCFLGLSSAYALEYTNSTDLLFEDIVDETVLYESGADVEDTRVDTYLNSSDVIKYYHGSERYNVCLYDDGGDVLANKNISILINGITYNRTTNDYGCASLGINLLSGNYSVFSCFNGDDYYKPCNCSNWVFVNSTILGDDLVKYFHNSSQYYSVFLSSNGVPLVNTNVTFNINGVFYIRKTDSTGWAHLNINLPPGNYIITAYNLVTEETHSNNIIILPILLAEDLTKAYRDENKFEVTVLDGEGNPYPNQQVQFNINGVFYNRISDVYGVARLNINLPVGIYIVTSSFNSAAISNRISVYEEFSGSYPSFVLNANDESFIYNSSFFYVYLGDDSGNPVSSKSVLLSVGDYACARLSDDGGYVKWFIDWNVGIYNVTVSVKYNHNVISEHYLITINKSDVLLCNNSPLFGYSNFLYSVKAKDYYNHSLCGLNISFIIGTDIFYNVTGEDGVAFCLFDLDIGEYCLNVSFEGNDNFNPSYSLQNITIKDIFIDKEGGFYNQSDLTVNIFSNNHDFYYSFDNSSWNNAYDNISIVFINGEWDLFYCTDFTMIYHNHYIVDNMKPIIFSNYGSGVYNETLHVNLTAIDNVDNNPMIYFSLNESNFILYDDLLVIHETSSLKFYAIDFNGHQSEVITCNFIFEKVGNLNSCKGFETIQSAIDDADTNNGDLIMVNEGLYHEHLTINKFVNLISINATLQGLNSSRPVIGITINGSNTTIQGFSIIDSEYGIVIFHAENVSIINNHFINVVSSIETVYDENTLIAFNSIDSNIFLNSMSGIVIRKSDNIMILNNNITLNSNDNASGIISLNTTSNNISITGNNINNKNKLNGTGLYVICSSSHIDSNNVSDFNVGLFMISSNSKVIHNNFRNNTYGAYLMVSINNTYTSNNIYNNKLCGFILDGSFLSYNDSFYLNRLYANAQYDFYSAANCSYVIDNNWWGENTPKISTNRYIFANIYNGTGNLIMNSWVIAQLFSSSYKINEYSQVERAKFYVDLTYNNLGNKLSSLGYIPNDLESFIAAFNINGNNKSNISYLDDGKAFVDFELSDLFENNDYIYVMAIFDSEKIIIYFNKTATIDISFFSSAWDMENEYFVNKTYHIPFTSNVCWITFSWGETGLYSGKIYLVVNGELIDEINISNIFYQSFKENYSTNVFEAIKFLNSVFASVKEGVWAPNGYYLSFAEYAGINPVEYTLVYNSFLDYLQEVYNLSNSDLNFIVEHKNLFIDLITMFVGYHGDITPEINFEYNGSHKLLNLPSGYAYRFSNIYYDDIEDENSISIGYEGMRSFAIVKNNLTSTDLSYWLDQKDFYSPGLMKAAYGTFLSSLLVIYENDRVADESATRFNVSWSRVNPVCVSLCNDYNCLYITGESNHLMGREAIGNAADVWNFNFATSFSFSLVEQLVGNNVWNTTIIGSVTLGLIESYLNNESLEVFISNGYVFIRCLGDNSALLFLDLETGIVRDCFSYYGLLGTMPCYHDNITENAWNYGNKLLNSSSNEFYDLNSVCNYSIYFAFFNNFAENIYQWDLESFFTSWVVGIMGGELVSAGTVLVIGGVVTVDFILFISGIILISIGEYGLLYSDGLLDGDITIIDGLFFVLDNAFAFTTPFSGGFKMGTHIVKINVERIILSKGGKIATIIRYDDEILRYGPSELILKNNHDGSIIEQIIDFFVTSILPPIFKETLDNNLG